jgi:hypothetical protein
MYSIVCPTMHRDLVFPTFLADLTRFHLISEIIIIDNDPSKRPKNPIFQHSKITLLEQLENIGVNPAWNLGVSISKNDHIAIFNDDIRMDLRIFYRVENLLDDPTTGMIGLEPGDHNSITFQKPVTSGIIDIDPLPDTQHRWGIGQAFFINKNNWEPIPENIKIFNGDDCILDGHKLAGRINHTFSNVLWNTPYSVTSRAFVNDYAGRDQMLYTKYHNERVLKHAKN